ncbi:Integrase, catalytic core protein, partial [Phytophthora megakarya]
MIMDGHSRFVTMHLLKSKAAEVVNVHIKEYVAWAERQARRSQTDGEAKTKYRKGIEHVKVGPKSSQLNLCERTHQSIVEMTKSMMHHAGFPRSLGPEALRNAIYVKNRVYNKGTNAIPFEQMFGSKPDIHHIKTFGSLAYVHVPVAPGRRKYHDNVKLGFVLGYAEDVVGCKVYFPSEHTAKFVPDLRVSEDVMYRDRHTVDLNEPDLESLVFTRTSGNVICTMKKWVQLFTAVSEGELESLDNTRELEEGAVVEPSPGEVDDNGPSRVNTETGCEMLADLADVSGVETESVVGVHGSVLGEQEDAEIYSEAAEVHSVQDDLCSGNDQDQDFNTEADDTFTVASVFAHASERNCSIMEDMVAECDGDLGESTTGQMESETEEETGGETPRLTTKRIQRDETPSEEERVERAADKTTPKRTRTGLREAHERRRPGYMDDYVVNALQNTNRVLDVNGKPIRASDVKIPRNHREAMRSKFADFWRLAELEEMAALKAKGVLKEIPGSEMPKDARAINTMWVYALKSDHHGYIIRFKGRTVALGNHQRPGIDFQETFSPVARMSSFRLLLALAAVLNLLVFGGDINTAYLKAWLNIPQYVRSIPGFPCDIDGHVYMVMRALYGLRQSGREWNSELNQWMLNRGFHRSLTEPCLYFLFEGDTIAYVLIYVDDILVATNREDLKVKLFSDLDEVYGIKDQGLLSQYLGIEVSQTSTKITIRQEKYSREILQKFGYDGAHAVGNPMETNARLVHVDDDEENDTRFPYREAIGMLMYLATSTRPDLAFVVSQLSCFVTKPSTKHVGTLKRVLRYLVGTVDYGISYERAEHVDGDVVLNGYCDSDWANDPESRKSTTGFVFTLAGGAVSWMSRKQSIVALSTAEAEYIAACEATMEAIAQNNILQEILPKKNVELKLGIDNQAALIMATNPTYSRRTRHIELRWHFMREQVEKGAIHLHKIKGDVNPADFFTKPLDKVRLKTLLQLIGIGGQKDLHHP